MKGKSHHFNVELSRCEHALQKIEARYFRSMANSREPPKKMRDLLDEYIVANKLEGKYDPLGLINDLKRNEDKERGMKD